MISGTPFVRAMLGLLDGLGRGGWLLCLSRRTVGTRSMGLSVLRPALHTHPKNAVHAFTSERLELAVTPRFSQEMMSSPVMSAGLFLALSARCPTMYHQFSMVAAELPCARIAPTQSSSHGVHSRGGCLRSENSIVAPLVNKKPANDWPAHISSGLSSALPHRGFHCLHHEVTHYKERYDTTGVIGATQGHSRFFSTASPHSPTGPEDGSAHCVPIDFSLPRKGDDTFKSWVVGSNPTGVPEQQGTSAARRPGFFCFYRVQLQARRP